MSDNGRSVLRETGIIRGKGKRSFSLQGHTGCKLWVRWETWFDGGVKTVMLVGGGRDGRWGGSGRRDAN